MSNTAINVRILFWHWQVTFRNEWSFGINKHRLNKKIWKSVVFPFAIYEFTPWKIRK